MRHLLGSRLGFPNLGNAWIVTHKVQRVALAAFERRPRFPLNPSATRTYNPALVWFHGCTIPYASPERIRRTGGYLDRPFQR